jgi:hypothetical protein
MWVIQIHNSNVKKQCFSEYVVKYNGKDYRLIRDVATRWSSTLLMIERVLKLKKVYLNNAAEIYS